MWRQITHGLRVLANRRTADRDLDDEIAHFVEERAAGHVARGLTPDAARRAARLEMGGPLTVRERVRDDGWEQLVATVWADVRLSLRMLRKSPVFALVVLAVIALGTGAVTTIFSAINALLLAPLPGVDQPARVITIERARRDGTVAQQASLAYYDHLRDGSRTVDALAAWGRCTLTIGDGGEGTAVFGNLVTANYFDVLGVRPALGRFFLAEENRTPGTHPVLVVSHAFWTAHLAGDRAAVGRVLTVNGRAFTLVGIAPADFRGVMKGVRPDAWVPLMMQPQLRPRSNLRAGAWLWLFGRLNAGTGEAAAQQELSALSTAYVRAAGEPDDPDALRSVQIGPLTGLAKKESRLLLGFLGLLLAAATLVLVIAGVNLAALLSARALARRRELAVRAALGAGRRRLLRQMLTEIVVLFLLGGAGGVLLAFAATATLEQIQWPGSVPISLELSPDGRVLGFTLGVCLAAGLLCGLPPAVRAVRRDLTARLREHSAGAGTRHPLLSRTLIVGQLALSLVLLVAAGLFLRAFATGQRVDPGFASAGVITAPIEPESWGYDQARAQTFVQSLRARLEALPGVTAVSYTSRLPLSAGSSIDDIDPGSGSRRLAVHYASVDSGYFTVLGLPLLEGRAIVERDVAEAPRVAVVNETLARRLRPDGRALGATFRFRGEPTTVVGIARDAKYATLGEDTPPFAYYPLAQVPQPAQALLVRIAGAPARMVPGLEQAARAIDPALPRLRLTTLSQATGIVLLPQRIAALVTATLGGIGLLLAAVGLYGVLSYQAGQRTREIGVRVALGADRATIVRLMVGDGIRLAGLGLGIGLALAVTASGLVRSWLFGVSPFDPLAFLGMSAVFVAVALLASYVPARRAAAADPLVALRTD